MSLVATDNNVQTGIPGKQLQSFLLDERHVIVCNLPEQGFQTKDGDILSCLPCIKQIEIHQRVNQRKHIVRCMPDIFSVFRLSGPFLFIGQQFCRCSDGGKGRTQVMGDSQHHTLPGLEKFRVFPVGSFQLTPVSVPSIQLPMYDNIKENSQQ